VEVDRFRKRIGIIAEFKRKSPSKGKINESADPLEVAAGYQKAGAAAMSILTDRSFFGGSLKDLRSVREEFPNLTILRKDFIIDPYQVHEASAYGADMILLIAAILSAGEVKELAMEARTLGLQVLFEVHHAEEMDKYHDSIGYVGVNNRDLKSFRVDTAQSLKLIDQIPSTAVPVSESGLGNRDELLQLRDAGYQLFLMGESFMKHVDPGRACEEFLSSLE
jgi:indole-3-glycerol phosphate synthase